MLWEGTKESSRCKAKEEFENLLGPCFVMPKPVSPRRIAVENARRLRTQFESNAENWHGWSGENCRRHWQVAKRFMVRFKPVLLKGKKGTYLVDVSPMSGETPWGIRLAISNNKKVNNLLAMRLDFHEKSVLIQAIQGEPIRNEMDSRIAGTDLPALREFETRTGKKAASYLFNELKAQARLNGYTKIRLIKPEELPNYKDPCITLAWQKKLEKKVEELRRQPKSGQIGAGALQATAEAEIRKQIRERMRKLYYGLAESEKLADNGTYWEIQLQ